MTEQTPEGPSGKYLDPDWHDSEAVRVWWYEYRNGPVRRGEEQDHLVALATMHASIAQALRLRRMERRMLSREGQPGTTSEPR